MHTAMGIVSSCRGCILGGAVGDAFGSAYEGQNPPIHINDDLPWVLTDDTQLTLATCEAITIAGCVDPEAIARRMTEWFRENRVTRLGAGTLKALSELSQGAHWALCGRRGEFAAGCGPAARAAPLAFWLDPANSDARCTIRDVARITHHSDEAYAGALAVVAAVCFAARGGWRPESGIMRMILPLLPDTNVRDRLTQFCDLDDSRPLTEIARDFGSSGYVAEAVPLSILAADRMLRGSFWPVMRELVSAGGDTDTIGSIAGQIAGAALGVEALAADFLDRVPGRFEIDAIARTFISALQRRTASDR